MQIDQAELTRRLQSSTNLVALAGAQLVDERPVVCQEEQIPDKDIIIDITGAKADSPFVIVRGKQRVLTQYGREVLGIQAHLTSPQEAADLMGVSISTARRHMDGKAHPESIDKSEDEALKERIEKGIQKVREQVVGRMATSLTNMGDEKFENLGAKELSVITSNLSRVMANTDKKEGARIIGNVNIISPQQLDESAYEQREV